MHLFQPKPEPKLITMSSLQRKRYYFNEEREPTYFCAMVNDTCTCLVCNASLALPKKGNVERHFMTRHAKYSITKIFFLEVKQGKWKLMLLNLICVNGLSLEQYYLMLSLTIHKKPEYEMLMKDMLTQISHWLFHDISKFCVALLVLFLPSLLGFWVKSNLKTLLTIW